MADFYRSVIEQLRMAQFELEKGGKGSHEKWRSVQNGKLVIVPRPLRKKHTANGVLKSAGLKKMF